MTSSQIQKLQKELEDKKLVFNEILDSTLAGFWDWRIQDNTEYLSPTFKKMFGYEDHEMENSPESWQKIIHPDDLPGVYDLFNQHIESKGTVAYDNEVRYYHKNGSIVWVWCRGKVIEWDSEGKPIRMIGSHVDITHLKNVTEELEFQKVQLSEKNQELEQFAYIASHDLQEPLRTISSFSTLLQENYQGKLDEEADMFINFILQSSDRMKGLITSMLDFSRIGRISEKETLKCEEILENVIADLKTRIDETQAQINCSGIPKEILGYKSEIRQLFQNLISNSIKFVAEGTLPQIQISCKSNSKFWEFKIQDNGIGISDENKEKIFGMFKRLHTQNEYKGTGIGLAHCKKIIELHGGTITVEDNQPSGSIFYFTISK